MNKSDEIVSSDIVSIVDDILEFSHILEDKRILVVGGRGFLGTYFIKVFQKINEHLKSPTKIIILDNQITSKYKEEFNDPNITFLDHDIIEPFSLPEELHYIIHTASIASPPIYRKFPIKTLDVNYQGTRNLLDLAKDKKILSMLFLSSSEIYGDPKVVPTPESYQGYVSCTGPRACYDESKRLAETISLLYFQQFNVPIKIVRPFNVYGPFLNLDDGRIIPDFMKNAFEKSEIVIHSDGSPTRSFCYVSDAIRAFFRMLLLAPNGSICNVGNDEEVSVLDVAKMIQKIFDMDVNIKIEKNSDPHYTTDNPQRRCPDLSLINSLVEYKPRIMFENGLKRVYDWYSGNLK